MQFFFLPPPPALNVVSLKVIDTTASKVFSALLFCWPSILEYNVDSAILFSIQKVKIAAEGRISTFNIVKRTRYKLEDQLS